MVGKRLSAFNSGSIYSWSKLLCTLSADRARKSPNILAIYKRTIIGGRDPKDHKNWEKMTHDRAATIFNCRIVRFEKYSSKFYC